MSKDTMKHWLTLLFVGISIYSIFTFGLEWNYKNNVLPTFTKEDIKEVEFLKSLTLMESLKYYKRNIEVNGFNLLKDESDVRAYELGGIKE